MNSKTEKVPSIRQEETDIPRCQKPLEDVDNFPSYHYTDRMIRAIKREQPEGK